MGVVADATIAAGGHATGVITESLAGHEIAHNALNDLHVVRTMHERKALMSDMADAFVMLPGGFGTCEEFMESVTWAQLGIHDKTCAILNVHGFFDHLLNFVSHAVEQGFIKSATGRQPRDRRHRRRAARRVLGPSPVRDLRWPRGRGLTFRRLGRSTARRQCAEGSSSTSRSSSLSPQSASRAATDEYGFSAPVSFSRSEGV